MKEFFVMSMVAATALTVSCESQNNAQNPGRAEQRAMAARAAAQQQSGDESQQNLMRAQQDVVNRDGNASRNLSGY